MNTLNTRLTRATSGVTRRNAHQRGKCTRCHRVGTFTPDSIVCDRCTSTQPSITTVTVTLILAAVGGER